MDRMLSLARFCFEDVYYRAACLAVSLLRLVVAMVALAPRFVENVVHAQLHLICFIRDTVQLRLVYF